MPIKERLLFVSGEGIGNVIQTIPVVRTLSQEYGIDYWHAFGSFPIQTSLFPYVNNWYCGKDITKASFSEYDGLVATWWVKDIIKEYPFNEIPLLNNITPLTLLRSEVECYMDIARDLGIQEDKLIYEGLCNYNKIEEKFDVVIVNGYNRFGTANWAIKGYPYYSSVVGLLLNEGLTVCSVGSKIEHIPGTEDRTGFSLLDTLGLIKNARCVISNDSGMYHASNSLKIPNVVIFTATSIEKNYDIRFHKYSTIVGRDDLLCRPCQKERRWNKDCKHWECRNIEPAIIFSVAMKILGREF